MAESEASRGGDAAAATIQLGFLEAFECDALKATAADAAVAAAVCFVCSTDSLMHHAVL